MENFFSSKFDLLIYFTLSPPDCCSEAGKTAGVGTKKIRENKKQGTHKAGAVGLQLLGLRPGQEGLDLVRGVVAGIVVRPHDRLDHLGLVGHLGHDPALHGLDPARLHGSQDLGLLTLRHTTKSHS